MKWKSKEAKIGETIIKKTFAIFPMKRGGEWRWLEWVKYSGRFKMGNLYLYWQDDDTWV